MTKTLIIGALGMLGKEVVRFFDSLNKDQSGGKDELFLIALDLDDVDIADKGAVFNCVNEHRPDLIINCAAYTNVDGCEENQQLAFAVNANGPRNLAEAAAEFHAKLVHISTDFVFDGEKGSPYVEDDLPHPLSIYGCSKLEGEQAVQASKADYIIVRTAWLYGQNGKNFVDTIRRLAKERDELAVVDDEVGSPTYAVDLAGAIWFLTENNCSGMFHVTNFGSCSRYEFARSIFDITGQNVRIRAISSAEFKRAARVPKNSTLDCRKFQAAVGSGMRPWRDALEDYLSHSP